MILPSSVTGSPRYMYQSYQDAMAICRRFGKPTFFITMTCNPKWPEIVEQLCGDEKYIDRRDVVVRVFSLKLKELLHDLDSGAFGKLRGRVHTIEFQKRSLPHAHIDIYGLNLTTMKCG